MKFRLNIPGLIVLALPVVPIMMFVVPPLINAHNSHLNYVGFGIVTAVVGFWLVLAFKVVYRAILRSKVKRLLK